jgi:hypothetical protein
VILVARTSRIKNSLLLQAGSIHREEILDAGRSGLFRPDMQKTGCFHCTDLIAPTEAPAAS